MEAFWMPASDRYHNCVRNALIKDGWVITHDPLRLSWGGKDMYVDLGAEQLISAEKGGRNIAVEVKTFGGPSEVDDLERALGAIRPVPHRPGQGPSGVDALPGHTRRSLA